MRTVIYDGEAMEPLTVVDVPESLFRAVRDGFMEEVRLAVPPQEPPAILSVEQMAEAMARSITSRTVRLRFDPVRKGGQTILWLCTTMDGESALLLRSTFLPGQRGEVNRLEEQAFLRGLLTSLEEGS